MALRIKICNTGSFTLRTFLSKVVLVGMGVRAERHTGTHREKLRGEQIKREHWEA